MSREERHLSGLAQFLPPDTFELVGHYFREHNIHLTLTRERKSVLGDYRAPMPGQPYHRISVNITLNPYSFLVTLLHELAHLLTFVQHHHTVSPHGKEWKAYFQQTLIPFLGKKIFPPDVEKALMAYLHNPAASTCTDPHLYKALHRYDASRPGWHFMDEIPPGQEFETEDGRRFVKLEKMRTRSRCKELKTGRIYLFPGISSVKVISP